MTHTATVAKRVARVHRHIEDDHQAAYFRWVDLRALSDKRYRLIYAIPNGGKRNRLEAARMKAQGTRPGVLDIHVAVPVGFLAPGLYIELKRPIVKGERKPEITNEQRDWLDRLSLAGYVCAVCYGWEDAKATTEAYLERGDDVPNRWVVAQP